MNNKKTRYEFRQFSRQSYYGIAPIPDGALDEICFGLYVVGDGCIAAATVDWTYLSGKNVPRLKVFSDGLRIAYDPKFVAAVKQLMNLPDPDFTPKQLCEILIAHGFYDMSDKPMEEADEIETGK